MDTLKARQIARELYSRMTLPSDVPVMHPAGDGKLFIIPVTPVYALGDVVSFYQIEPFSGSVRALEEVKEKELREINFLYGVLTFVNVLVDMEQNKNSPFWTNYKFASENELNVIPSFYIGEKDKKEVSLFFGLKNENEHIYITENNVIEMLSSISTEQNVEGFAVVVDKNNRFFSLPVIVNKFKFSSLSNLLNRLYNIRRDYENSYPILYKIVLEVAEEFKERG